MKYVSLFSGVGGLEWGLEKMGAECVGYSEIRPNSIKIYQKNWPGRPFLGDVTKVDVAALPDFDILVGGFPCQSFSLAGLRKGMNDPRGIMIFHIRNFLVAKQPKWCVLENVLGLLTHNDGKSYEDIFKVIQSAGYFVRVVQLNAAHYGSAQARERLFFLCCREDFPVKKPVITDATKVFEDFKDLDGPYDMIKRTPRNELKVEQGHVRNFEIIADTDRVGTLTTQFGCGEKAVKHNDWVRALTVRECEALMHFPKDYTAGVSKNGRYFALGNAVHCAVSEYLFTDYLKGLWW